MKKSHSSKQWLRRHVNDPYVQRARKDGYRSRSAYKLTEIDERDKLLLGNLSLEGRHDRLEAFDDLRTRIEDRVADVLIVGFNRVSANQFYIFAVNSFELRSALARPARVESPRPPTRVTPP